MKRVMGGVLYDTDDMEVIVHRSAYVAGNYVGQNWIGKTQRGNYASVQQSNGYDVHRDQWIMPIAVEDIAADIDGWEVTAEEAERLLKLGAIKFA